MRNRVPYPLSLLVEFLRNAGYRLEENQNHLKNVDLSLFVRHVRVCVCVDDERWQLMKPHQVQSTCTKMAKTFSKTIPLTVYKHVSSQESDLLWFGFWFGRLLLLL